MNHSQVLDAKKRDSFSHVFVLHMRWLHSVNSKSLCWVQEVCYFHDPPRTGRPHDRILPLTWPFVHLVLSKIQPSFVLLWTCSVGTWGVTLTVELVKGWTNSHVLFVRSCSQRLLKALVSGSGWVCKSLSPFVAATSSSTNLLKLTGWLTYVSQLTLKAW